VGACRVQMPGGHVERAAQGEVWTRREDAAGLSWVGGSTAGRKRAA
jgi:hypothetical protein